METEGSPPPFFCWPPAERSFNLTVWINLCSREPERESEAFSLIKRRIRRFFAVYAPETQR